MAKYKKGDIVRIPFFPYVGKEMNRFDVYRIDAVMHGYYFTTRIHRSHGVYISEKELKYKIQYFEVLNGKLAFSWELSQEFKDE